MVKENHQQKLGFGFLNLLEQALKIPLKNPHLIIFTFLTSIPLFTFLVLNEEFLQTTLSETLDILAKNPTNNVSIHVILRIVIESSYKLVQLGLFYLVPIYVYELGSMIVAVKVSAGVYAGEWTHKPATRAMITGIVSTYIYSVLLSIVTLLGSIWLAVNYFLILRNYFYNMFFAVLYRAACIAMMTKYLEISVVWNMAVVIPVLEEKYGADAFMLSAHLNRGNERCGTLLMFVFFVWGICLRLPCFFLRCNGKWSVIVVQAALFCVGNMMKWVSGVVYFYNCKKGMSENADDKVAVDLECCDNQQKVSQITKV